MASKSKRKGADYERYIAKRLSKGLNSEFRRTPGSGNLDIKGDIRDKNSPYLSGPLAGWVLECKKQEHLNVWDCIHQAQQQAKHQKWALIFSRNCERDYVVIDLDDFMELIQCHK